MACQSSWMAANLKRSRGFVLNCLVLFSCSLVVVRVVILLTKTQVVRRTIANGVLQAHRATLDVCTKCARCAE